MRKLLFIFLFLPILSKAQFIIAGQPSLYYKDIIPDTTISIPNPNTTSKYYKLDVDGDSSDDLIFYFSSFWSLGGNSSEIYLQVLNPKLSLKIKRIDSTFIFCSSSNTFWHTTKVLKHYSYGDTIQTGPITSNIGYIYSNGKTCCCTWNIIDWSAIGDQYIGFTYTNGTNIDYGWIRISGGGSSITIKDFTLNSAYVGVDEMKKDNMKIYPNPTSTILNISSEQKQFQNSEVEITNYLGQTVLKTEYTNTLDVSKLANGIYTLRIIGKEDQNYYSKFVKE